MIKKLTILFWLALHSNLLFAKPIFSLKGYIRETSASVYDKELNAIWSLGDGGKSTGIVAQTELDGFKTEKVLIKNTQIYDWEAMVSDEQGNLWILDVGDNQREKKIVYFYQLDNKNWSMGQDLHVVKTIKIEYPGFSMDCEAAVFYNQHIYLFEKKFAIKSKNKIVAVDMSDPDQEFKTANIVGYLPKTSWITDAGLDDDNNLILLNYWGLYRIKNWLEKKPTKTVVHLGFYGQQESLVVFDNSHFLIGIENGKFYSIMVRPDF